MPIAPGGQRRPPPGASANARAAITTGHAAQPATCARAAAAPGSAVPSASAPTPASVTGTANGVATALAGTAHGPTSASMAASSGRQAACAATVTATISARAGAIHRAARAASPGASSAIEATALTDSPRPTSVASVGRTTISTTTVAASAGIACDRRPARVATAVTAAMPSARSTDPPPETTAASATHAPSTMPAIATGVRRNRRATPPTAAARIAKCAPETAVR